MIGITVVTSAHVKDTCNESVSAEALPVSTTNPCDNTCIFASTPVASAF